MQPFLGRLRSVPEDREFLYLAFKIGSRVRYVMGLQRLQRICAGHRSAPGSHYSAADDKCPGLGSHCLGFFAADLRAPLRDVGI